MAKKAIVLAAGFGKRLRPFTSAVPKPLLPVWGEPMLARVVRWLRERGVEEIAVNCHYLHEQVEAWCAANGCRASYEPEILGTGGALKALRDFIGDDDFWLVNGDIVFEGAGEIALPETADEIGVCLASETAGPRTIEAEPERHLVTCWKSPDPGWPGTYTYCGVACLKAEILKYVKPDGFSTIIEAYEKAAMDGLFVRAVVPEGLLWTDAGTVASYLEINEDKDENAFADLPQLRAAGITGDIVFKGARGSDRAFFKAGEKYAIVYDDAARGENAKYASHARWLKEKGIKVPAVLADLPEMKTLVLENAGSEDLLARAKRRGEDRLYDYVAVVEELVKFNALDPAGLALEPPFDAALYAWERDLFKEHCLGGYFRCEMSGEVEAELVRVADRLLKEPPALVHRDFQSTNVIWKNDAFKIIDFQGMRRGAAAYDLASLLYDPYIDLRAGERRALAALYAKKSARAEDGAFLTEVLPCAAVERLVQALGAYGRLTALGKTEFEKHILPALENLLEVADTLGLEALGALAEELIARATKKTAETSHACTCHDHGHEHGHACTCHDHGHEHACTCHHHHHGGEART